MNNKIFAKAQKLGKALMLPIAVMPAVALILRLGVLWNIPFMTAAGQAVIDNLALLFAIGVAVGIAKEGNGAAGLAGIVAYFTITNCAISINENINPNTLKIPVGIISGIISGGLYNKYKDIKLPDWLAFFGGKRFVPIVTSVAGMGIGLIFGYVWIYIQNGIDAIGHWVIGAGSIGLFIYGVLNRLLIPIGLHHIINTFLWQVFGQFNGVTGDFNRFISQNPAQGLVDPTAGMFMTGFFPIMMFGLPAAALAMYTTAKTENKKMVSGIFLSLAVTSFLTGITEPIEFLFMFIAPALYVVHAILTGLSMAITYTLGMRLGFGFSAGLFDYILNWQISTKPILLIPVGLAFAAVYYFVFVAVIKFMNIKTPGREDEVQEKEEFSTNDDFLEVAKAYLEALGGKENIDDLDSCITRLRLNLKDTSIVDEPRLKKLGASGVIKINKNSMQVVVGTKVELICNKMKELI